MTYRYIEIKLIRTIFILVCLSSYLFSYNIDSLGINNNKTLNSDEYEYIKGLIKSRKLSDDSLMIDYKYVFVTGNTGSRILSKKDFFKMHVIPWIEKEQKPAIWIKCLTEDEKRLSGGYDAIMCVWVKMFTDNSRRKIIKKLKKKR